MIACHLLIPTLLAVLSAAEPAQADDVEPEAVTISGQVFNHVGAGVKGMQVEVYRVDEQGAAVGEPLTQTSAEQYGDFTLTLPAGTTGKLVVRLSGKGYAVVEQQIELAVEAPPPFVDVAVQGAGRLEGVVRARADDAPIPAAHVVVTDGFAEWTADTDERGRFAIEGLPPRPSRVSIDAEGFARRTEKLEGALGRGEEPLEVWLAPEWSATVKIVAPFGEPIPDVFIEALAGPHAPLLTASTDEKGEAVFRGLDPEVDMLRMRFNHFILPKSPDFDHFLINEENQREVREVFHVVMAARIKGTVVDAATGEPIYSARVMAGEFIGANVPMAWSDPDGEFELVSLMPGELVLTVHASGYAPELRELKIESGHTERVNVRLTRGRAVRGRVVDEAGAPLAGAYVSVDLWRGYSTAGMKALTDEQGGFVFDHAPADPLDLSAMASGHVPMQRQLKTDEELRFELRKLDPREAAGPASKIGVGDALPELELTTLDGQKIGLAALRGKVVLLDFWATWCGPCRLELPYVKQVHEAFGGRSDFVLLGISLDQREAVLREFIKKEQIGWPQVRDAAAGGSTISDAFGVHGIPATFLVGRDGKVIAVGLRGEQMKAEIEKALR